MRRAKLSWFRRLQTNLHEGIGLEQLANPVHTIARMKRFWLFLSQTASSITRHQTFTIASALAFNTLLAIVPLLLIGIAVASALGAENGRSYIDDFFRALQERLPDTPALEPLLALLRSISARSREIAGIGLVLLFITAYSLLSSVEYAFNRIWQVTAQRKFLNRSAAYLATIIIVPVLMSFSVYFNARVETVSREMMLSLKQENFSIVGLLRTTANAALSPSAPLPAAPTGQAYTPVSAIAPDPQVPAISENQDANDRTNALNAPRPTNQTASTQPMLTKLILGLFSITFTCAALTLLFYFMPYTPVRWSAALYGGIFSGFLVEMTKYLFSYYAQYAATNLTRLYGSTLLAFPLALLWLWLVWVLILLGGEIAFNLQNYRDLAVSGEIERRGLRHRLYLAVRITLLSSELFHRGERPDGFIDHAAAQLALPAFAVRTIVQQLCQKEILREVSETRDGYIPGKDLLELTVLDVVRAVAQDDFTCPENGRSPNDRAHKLLAGLFENANGASREQLARLTLREFLELEGFATRHKPEPTPI